jgi:signal transduction histidine kinase
MSLDAETETAKPPAPRFNILLVDDQPDGLLALEAILGPLGQNLVRASSGREALRLLLKDDYALILLDVVMPGMDGFETAALIREREKTKYTPIIFLTAARKGEGPLNRGYETGAVDFIYKPIDPDVLKSKVRVFVDLARKTQLVLLQQEALRLAQHREHQRSLAEALARVEADRLRREMEERTAQQQWLEAVLDALPAPLLLTDPRSGMVGFANRAAQPIARQMGAGEGALAQPDSPLQQAARGQRFEGLALDWDNEGKPSTLMLTSERLPAMLGRGETVIVSALDITELKRTEAKLQRAVRARDEFMSAASHELNTPLTTIVLQLDSLQRHLKKAGLGEDPKAVKVMGTLTRNVDRLGRLIAELLDVSRIAEGRLKLDLGDVDLSEVVRDVTQRFEEQMSRAGCKLELTMNGPVVGRWDKSRLDQVVTNLLTNAMKYAPGKPVEITVSGDDDIGKFIIKDHGIGIAKENHARVFERFERAVPTENYAGLGLGLWIVSRIVGEMGGTIALDSDAGQGATFTVALPRALGRTAEGTAPQVTSASPLSMIVALKSAPEVLS